MSRPSIVVALALVAGCAPAATKPDSPPAPSPPVIELVESWPVETTLDSPDLRDAKDVWLELVEHARTRLDFAEFYASDDPKGRSALTPIVEAIERAVARGVKVRWLADEHFAKTYPELLARFAKAGVDVRRFDVSASMGGVLHAKYFLADDVAYLGSQNFDWRSLTQIQELGVRVTVPEVVRALGDVFDFDWQLAAGTRPPSTKTPSFPVSTAFGAVTFVASPKGFLPDERAWDLPAIVGLIDGAKRSVRAQLLTYKAHGGRDGDFPEIEGALERAAARGVEVDLLVSDWSQGASTIDGLRALAAPPRLQIKLISIPQASTGFIPFARVAHAKFLVVDGARAWVGTSNWERDYFYASRNVGVVIDGGPLPARLDALFVRDWSSPYAAPLDPTRAYESPRISE